MTCQDAKTLASKSEFETFFKTFLDYETERIELNKLHLSQNKILWSYQETHDFPATMHNAFQLCFISHIPHSVPIKEKGGGSCCCPRKVSHMNGSKQKNKKHCTIAP